MIKWLNTCTSLCVSMNGEHDLLESVASLDWGGGAKWEERGSNTRDGVSEGAGIDVDEVCGGKGWIISIGVS